MANTILIARLLGPVVVMASIALLAYPGDIRQMAREFLDSRALIFLTGVLAMAAGLAIVNTHNVWVAGWPVLITLFGWAMVIGGAIRIALPAAVKSIGNAMLDNPVLTRIAGVVWLVVGLYVTYEGYL